MNMGKTVLLCEDTMEGIFTAVYDGWKDGRGGREVEVRTREPENLELFTVFRRIDSDREKAGKVMGTIQRKLGGRVYEDICYAAAADSPERGTAVYHVLRRALGEGRCDPRVMEALADPYVSTVARLRVKVWHEFHRYLGFLRFRELPGHVLFGKISPDNDILEMLGPHFASRFPNENWMIYDEKREKVLVHPRGGSCTLQREVQLREEPGESLAQPEEYEELWKAFCRSISIKERTNGGLQQQLLPLKFRPHMVEFH